MQIFLICHFLIFWYYLSIIIIVTYIPMSTQSPSIPSSYKKRKAPPSTTTTHPDLEWLVSALEASGLDEFMEYIRSPWKMLWPNFVAGVARGFWALVGVTIVITIIWWILSWLIDIPLIGKKLEPYVEYVQTEFKKYTEATNYRDNFERMEATLNSIDQSLKQ